MNKKKQEKLQWEMMINWTDDVQTWIEYDFSHSKFRYIKVNRESKHPAD